MSDWVIFALTMALASFVQSLTGFGQALVAMPLLVLVLPLRVAAPLVAIYGVVLNIYVFWRYGGSFGVKEVWRPLVASLPAVPLGVWALRLVGQRLVLAALGGLLIAYSLYALLAPRMPRLRQPVWGFLAGALSGLLGGAYNTSGPPLVVYGDLRGWERPEFKANLQGLFFVGNTLALLSHALAGNVTWEVGQRLLVSLPFAALGLWSGTWMDRYLNPQVFHRIVLVLLLAMGIRLVM